VIFTCSGLEALHVSTAGAFSFNSWETGFKVTFGGPTGSKIMNQ